MPAWVGHFNVTMWLSGPDNHRPHEGFGRTMDVWADVGAIRTLHPVLLIYSSDWMKVGEPKEPRQVGIAPEPVVRIDPLQKCFMGPSEIRASDWDGSNERAPSSASTLCRLRPRRCRSARCRPASRISTAS